MAVEGALIVGSGVTPDSVRWLTEVGVTATQDYAWFYRGEPYSPVTAKKDSMSRFAEQYLQH